MQVHKMKFVYRFIIKEKNKNATNVASIVKHKVLAKLSNYNRNNYINVFVNNDNVEDASVASMVTHQPHELGPSGLPGSKLYLSESPGWGDSTLKIFGSNFNKKKLFTNLEFRNSSNDLVGFFDNTGNLKLLGSLNENYASP